MVTFINFSCVSYIYLRVQQKQLSSHTKIGATDGGGGGEGKWLDRHDFILWFQKTLLESINLTDMFLSYDFIYQRFHHHLFWQWLMEL